MLLQELGEHGGGSFIQGASTANTKHGVIDLPVRAELFFRQDRSPWGGRPTFFASGRFIRVVGKIVDDFRHRVSDRQLLVAGSLPCAASVCANASAFIGTLS